MPHLLSLSSHSTSSSTRGAKKSNKKGDSNSGDDSEEKITAIYPLSTLTTNTTGDIIFVTKDSFIKKTSINQLVNINKNGKLMMTLKDKDELRYMGTYDGKKNDSEMLIITK